MYEKQANSLVYVYSAHEMVLTLCNRSVKLRHYKYTRDGTTFRSDLQNMKGETNRMVSRGARRALVMAPAKAPLRNSPTSLVFKKS